MSASIHGRTPVLWLAGLLALLTTEGPSAAATPPWVVRNWQSDEGCAATYGSLQCGAGLADVTEPLRRLIRDGRLETIDYRDFAGDPSPNMAKKLRVDYTVGGQPHTVMVTEHQILQLPQAADGPGELRVVRGIYGGVLPEMVEVSPLALADITVRIARQVHDGRIAVRVDKNLAGVDPAPQRPKKLWLEYAVDGFLGNLVLDDGEELRLPEHPVGFLPPSPTLAVTSAGTVLRAWDAGRYVMAEVRINGRNLGILWKAPYRVDLTSAARAGRNALEIEVTNLWPNRLIGDEQWPEDIEWVGLPLKGWPDCLLNGTPQPVPQRVTFTTWHHWRKDAQLLPSGLLGPVMLRTLAVVPIPATEK